MLRAHVAPGVLFKPLRQGSHKHRRSEDITSKERLYAVMQGKPLENLRAFCPGEGSLITDALVKR